MPTLRSPDAAPAPPPEVPAPSGATSRTAGAASEPSTSPAASPGASATPEPRAAPAPPAAGAPRGEGVVPPQGIPPAPGPPRAAHRARPLWLGFLALALVELTGSIVVRARVVPAEDWAAATARVRRDWAAGDALVSAPGWTDPLLREAAPDLLDVASAARSDLSGVRRLWSLSIRGHRPEEAPPEAPELRELVGRVLVERWRLPYRPVLYDFVANAAYATYVRDLGADGFPCRPGGGRASGGGLGAGPVLGAGRASCEGISVGETVIEDLSFAPRHCILLPPAGPSPVRARFEDVPLGETLVAHAGLHWVEERHGLVGGASVGAPVSFVVRAGATELLRVTHADGEGWRRYEREIPAELVGTRATVSVATTADDGANRSFCWSAVTLGAPERGEVAAAPDAPHAAGGAEAR